jgi:RND family efflux transporter MFP subunit
VRYIQLFDWGWDSHGTNDQTDLRKGFVDKCRQVDQPVSALLTDLDRRGLLDETLVIWSGEFGRTPMRENRGGRTMKAVGRDHSPTAYTLWMAGGGIKPGISYGETDPVGYEAVADKVSSHDLHATLLTLLGFDHKRLTFPFQGLDQRLSNVTKPSRAVASAYLSRHSKATADDRRTLPPQAADPWRSQHAPPAVPFAKSTRFGHLSPPPMQAYLRILIPVLILAAGFGAWKWLGQKPEPPKPVMRPPQKLEAEVLKLQRNNFPVILQSQGSVRAHHLTTLTPLVAGRIVTVHPEFEDGAFFNIDDPLIELDPSDYKAALAGARARLARAQAALAQEEARAKQAKLNWEEIGYDEPASDLVLRIPQLNEARANVEATEADLDQAIRDLDRTVIRAPFAGRVQNRMTGLGQTVGQGTVLGEIFATDYAEVRLPLTPRQISFITLPEQAGDQPVAVTLTDALGTDSGIKREAIISRTEGTLDEDSRELFVIARIDDPFGLQSDLPPLRIGQPVRAAIEGTVLEDIFVIPRHALRGVDTIHLVQEGTLQRQEITPCWSTDDVIVVRDGLEPGQLVITSRLPYRPDGAPIEIIEQPAAVSTPEKSEPEAGAGDS